MHMLALRIALALTLVSLASVAHAGAKWSSSPAVSIKTDPTNPNLKDAQGRLGEVRNTPDATQNINCAVFAWSTGNPLVMCAARDPSGLLLSCSSSVPSIVQTASALSSDSGLHFYVNTKTNECTMLIIDHDSGNEPKR
jgi:hypothetical protein